MDFSQIALILVVAATFGIVAKTLKQPLIVGYIFAGIFIGSLGVIENSAALIGLGNIGVTLLLFLLGLEMKLSDIPSIGKIALLTGIGQMIFTSLFGFALANLLGFGLIPSIYIAIALTFSSTIIMVKLLSEKKALSSLYGKISVGFLLVQDVVAILILMFLAGFDTNSWGGGEFLMIGLKAIALFVLVWLASKKILPVIIEKLVGNSTELLFIVSIAWALGVAYFVGGVLNFSIEIGGFLAGISLSNLPEHNQIATRVRPLRDFFLTIFFILLGTHLALAGNILLVIAPAVLLSTFVLIGNPVIVMSIMGIMGYKKRTSFMAGLTVAQISEFSLIIVAMGVTLGHLRGYDMSVVTLVAVITMTMSTYLILGSDKVYRKLEPYLSIFERKKPKEKVFIKETQLRDHVVLVGCDRTGNSIIPYLKKLEVPFVVVDFNPKVYETLTANNHNVVFGDISDDEIVEAARVDKAKMVISTTYNLSDNIMLLESIKKFNNSPATIFTISRRSEALKLYEYGANYVIVPDVLAGDYIRHILRTYGFKGKRLKKAGKSHYKRLIFT